MSVRAIKSGAEEFLTKPLRAGRNCSMQFQHASEQDGVRRQQAGLVAELGQRPNSLTSREREVLPLVITGRLNKEIADQLDLSEVTVKVHRGQIMRKMRSRSLVDLVRMVDKLRTQPGKL
jgi:FixJ family two-component response regulator